MSDVAFPATTWDQFPPSLHSYLADADAGNFSFPVPENMIAPPLTELSAKQERIVKFAYFNYWLAALRVYYINAAWALSWPVIDRSETGPAYAVTCSMIDVTYAAAQKELYIHYGYDYEGPPPR